MDEFERRELITLGQAELKVPSTSSQLYSIKAKGPSSFGVHSWGKSPQVATPTATPLPDHKFKAMVAERSQHNESPMCHQNMVSGRATLKDKKNDSILDSSKDDIRPGGRGLTKKDVDRLHGNNKVSKATVLLNKLHKLEKKIAQKMKIDEKEKEAK